MTRVWSMATQPSHTDRDIAQLENAIVYVCGTSPQRLSQTSSQSVDSGVRSQSSLNYAQEISRLSLLPFPLSLITWNSGLTDTSNSDQRMVENQDSPHSDEVNVELRNRSGNGHIHARRAVSVSLPLDSETIRSVGISLRRISEEFEDSTSRTILSDSIPSLPSLDGLFTNMLASIGLSRRRPQTSRRNGRQRSFSTNDATQQ